MNKSIRGALHVGLIVTVTGVVQAAGISGQGSWETSLQGRDLDGDPGTTEAYFDTRLGITWLADANYAYTSGFQIPNGGGMDWTTASGWVTGLTLYGIDGWRLPAMVDTGAPGCDYAYVGTDCGYNVQTTDGTLMYSELASLFYDTLGNTAAYDTQGNANPPGSGLPNPGPFVHLVSSKYWTGLTLWHKASHAWSLDFNSGAQGAVNKVWGRYFAWLVHDGDIGQATGLPAGAPAIETGAAAGSQPWNSVALYQGFTDKVVIAGPPSADQPPGVVRLRPTGANTFHVRFQTWDYLPRATGWVNIPYLAIQPGRHLMSDGSIWEAGTLTHKDTYAWKAVNFAGGFPTTPHLFLTIQTNNGGSAVTARARNVTATGFEVRMFEQESDMNGHSEETIGYLAIFSPTDAGTVTATTVNNFQPSQQAVSYTLQQSIVNHQWTPVLGQQLRMEEEQSLDAETWHSGETVDVLELGGRIFAQDVSTRGIDTAAVRQRY